MERDVINYVINVVFYIYIWFVFQVNKIAIMAYKLIVTKNVKDLRHVRQMWPEVVRHHHLSKGQSSTVTTIFIVRNTNL